jgi:hypothetical protein
MYRVMDALAYAPDLRRGVMNAMVKPRDRFWEGNRASALRVWLFPPQAQGALTGAGRKPSGIGVPERVHFTEF